MLRESISGRASNILFIGNIIAQFISTYIVPVHAIFNRAPDADGLAYWVAELDGGVTAKESMIVAIVNGALDTDQTILDNKTAVSTYFADAGLNTTDFALTSVTADAATVTAAQASVDAINPALAGETFVLTTGDDTFIGTAANDTFNGTSATLATADTIIDQSSTDDDTLNATLTTAMLVGTHDAKISGVENVNFDWNAFGTATIEAGNISGATITGTSSKTGFLGSMTVNGAGANTIVAGTGMDGTLTVADATTSTVNAGEATKVSVTAAGTATANDTLTLTAGSATTQVTIADFDSAIVDAGKATVISLTDDATGAITAENTVALTFSESATLANDVDLLTITAAVADKTLTLTNTAGGVKAIDVAGDKAMTIKVADAGAAINTGSTITKSGTGTFTYQTGNIGTAADLSKIAADLFHLTGTQGATTTTFATGANVTVDKDLGNAAATFAVGGTAITDTLNVTLKTGQTGLVGTGIETLNVTVDATAVANAADATLSVLNNGTNKIVLTTANDIVVTAATAKTVDATAVTADLSITQATGVAVAMDINGGSAKNTIVFDSETADNNYVGQDGVDDVTFATTTASAVAVLGNGNNKVTATTLTTGSNLVVNAGSGNDTVTATATTDSNITLELGDGNNVMTIDTDGAGADLLTVVTGSGNDKLTLGANTDANDVMNLNFGAGTNTLAFDANSADISLGSITESGLNAISLLTGGTTTVAASLVSGKTISVSTSDGAAGSLGIKGTVALGETIDASSLVLDQTIAAAVTSVVITGNAGNDTIIGSSIGDTIDTTGGTNTVTGGLGADVMTSNGVDTFVIAQADSGLTTATADSIVTFATTSDKLSLGTAGTATNFAVLDTNVATGAADEIATVEIALGLLNTAGTLDGTVRYAYVTDAGTAGDAGVDSYLFVDANLDGTADYAIEITGIATAGVVAADIVA